MSERIDKGELLHLIEVADAAEMEMATQMHRLPCECDLSDDPRNHAHGCPSGDLMSAWSSLYSVLRSRWVDEVRDG